MAENSRIDDLRRRVQKDPASIAFAQLAEECRRAGEFQEAVDTCRAGLGVHPGYLSARVTLGRALVELGQLDDAKVELSRVLDSAPENLAAIRGLAEIHHRRGELAQALAQYRTALVLAPNDPDLEETVNDLSRQSEPAEPSENPGLTMAHMQEELQQQTPPVAEVTPPVPMPPPAAVLSSPVVDLPPAAVADVLEEELLVGDVLEEELLFAAGPDALEEQVGDTLTPALDDRAARTVAALEQWLDAIHVARADRHP